MGSDYDDQRSSPLTVESAAAEIKSAQDEGRQIAPLSSRHDDFSLATAYEIAHHIHTARMADGIIPVGRKIGFTNRGIWSKFGIDDPVWGYLYDTTVELLDDVQGACALAGLAEPRIEPEIVFRLQSDASWDMALYELVDAIDWVAHGYEIVRSSYPNWDFQAADAVADSAFHARLLIGPTLRIAELGDEPVTALETFSLDLSRDGTHVETGQGGDVLGNPLSAVRHLMRILDDDPDAEPLQAGDIVTTGTVTAAHSIGVGEHWHSEVDGISLPGLTLELLP